MKQSMVALLLLTAIGCSKHGGGSKFAGTWSGSYNSTIIATNPPAFDTGTLHIAIDASNNATGTLQSLRGGASTIMKGTLNPSSGALSIAHYGEGDDGIMVFLLGCNGILSVDAGSGTLTFPWATTSVWRVTKN